MGLPKEVQDIDELKAMVKEAILENNEVTIALIKVSVIEALEAALHDMRNNISEDRKANLLEGSVAAGKVLEDMFRDIAGELFKEAEIRTANMISNKWREVREEAAMSNGAKAIAVVAAIALVFGAWYIGRLGGHRMASLQG